MGDVIKYLNELTERECELVPEMAMDRITYAIQEIKQLQTINKALMNALDAAIDYTIMKDQETYAALEKAITAATEAYDASIR